MRELEIYEAGIHTCGYHRDLLEDKANGFAPEEWTCPVCQGAKRYSKMLQRMDDVRRDKSDPYAPHPADGREIRMRLMSAAEVANLARGHQLEHQQHPGDPNQGR